VSTMKTSDTSIGDVQVAPEFSALDTMRAVGALGVLTTHTSFQTGEYLGNGVFGTLLARLDVGVAIFFVLSGFLLSRPYFARSHLGLPAPALGRYYEKRALRIMPVYVITVVVALLLVPGNDDVDAWQWASSLLLLDPYHLEALPHGLTHMWSLSAEVAFYLILPALMLLLIGRRARPRRLFSGLVVLTVIAVLWHAWLSEELAVHVSGATGLWLPAYLTWFAAGIALAWAHVELQAGRRHRLLQPVQALLSMPGVCWTAVAGLLLVAATPLAGPTLLVQGTQSESVTKHVLYACIGVLIVGSGVFAAPSGAYGRAFSWAPLRHVGHISYGMFCIHLALLSLVFELLQIEPFTGHGLQVWMATLALSLVASEVLYRLVEMPAMRLKRRWRRDESESIEVTAARAPHEATTTR
jgi:peptidoglycan/LPS O-acetylase OafA/YrhL